ncbi:hypothetical protein PIB30_036847 [Stylosanthes scabra]|uniref:Uncharacterized protein n=1 Tax=Stylosanthes scabra TaxID=79078 RepID=A0ABU6TDE8_9FABA|nr:hypothetical protein [Stylosanthes scabra]
MFPVPLDALIRLFKCFRVSQAKIGAKVAKESARIEKIAKKSLEAKSSAYAYAPKTDVRTHCHDLGFSSKLEPDPMRTHLRDLCRVVILCPGRGLRCADNLSHRSLSATDGRNGVSLEAVNAMPLPITGGP